MTARHAAAAPKAAAFPHSLRIATAVAVIGISAAACGTQVATGQRLPPKLRLSGIPMASSPGSQQPGAPGSGVQPGGPVSPGPSGWVRVEVRGGLPASGPSAGVVRQLPGGPAPRSEVLALAAALHLAASPQRSGSGWRVTGPGTLEVSGGPGLRWTYTARPTEPCGGPIMKYAAAQRHGPAPGPIELTAWMCPQAGPATGAAQGPATGTAWASGRGPGSGAGSLEPSDPWPVR